MRKFFFGLAIVLASMSLKAELPPGWSTNYSEKLAEAQGKQSPMLVYFTASWCGPCKLMTRTTLTNEAVLKILAGLGHIALDIDQFPELAEQHQIRAVPTFEILTASGAEVVRVTGFQSPDEFVTWLTNGVAEATEVLSRRQRQLENLEHINQSLAGTDPAGLRSAATNLFELCAERDPIMVQAAISRLKILAAREPEVLLEGLMDRRLVIRIQLANMLRAQLGEAFDFDPWSAQLVRAAWCENWRQRERH